MRLLVAVLVGVAEAGAGAEQERAECVMWAHLENKTMPLQDQGHATCRTNQECSGFTCDGHFKVRKYSLNTKYFLIQNIFRCLPGVSCILTNCHPWTQ